MFELAFIALVFGLWLLGRIAGALETLARASQPEAGRAEKDETK